MSNHQAPVLIAGGSGVVGAEAAAILRQFHPGLPLVIGGRDIDKASEVAARIGNARGIVLDTGLNHLGLATKERFAAVAVFLKDENLNLLRFAQERGLPYVGISSGLLEIGPEVIAFSHGQASSAVLVASHVLAGAAVWATLDLASGFDRVETIRVTAIMDEADGGGPAASTDLERLMAISNAGLIRRDGRFTWLLGDDVGRVVSALDGTRLDAQSLAVPDVVSLAMATSAPNVRLDMAVGSVASRRPGQAFPIEILIELEGTGAQGELLRVHGGLAHPGGMRPLTALSVVVGIERLAGLDGRDAAIPGLYMPETLVDPAYFMKRAIGLGAVFQRI